MQAQLLDAQEAHLKTVAVADEERATFKANQRAANRDRVLLKGLIASLLRSLDTERNSKPPPVTTTAPTERATIGIFDDAKSRCNASAVHEAESVEFVMTGIVGAPAVAAVSKHHVPIMGAQPTSGHGRRGSEPQQEQHEGEDAEEQSEQQEQAPPATGVRAGDIADEGAPPQSEKASSTHSGAPPSARAKPPPQQQPTQSRAGAMALAISKAGSGPGEIRSTIRSGGAAGASSDIPLQDKVAAANIAGDAGSVDQPRSVACARALSATDDGDDDEEEIRRIQARKNEAKLHANSARKPLPPTNTPSGTPTPPQPAETAPASAMPAGMAPQAPTLQGNSVRPRPCATTSTVSASTISTGRGVMACVDAVTVPMCPVMAAAPRPSPETSNPPEPIASLAKGRCFDKGELEGKYVRDIMTDYAPSQESVAATATPDAAGTESPRGGGARKWTWPQRCAPVSRRQRRMSRRQRRVSRRQRRVPSMACRRLLAPLHHLRACVIGGFHHVRRPQGCR